MFIAPIYNPFLLLYGKKREEEEILIVKKKVQNATKFGAYTLDEKTPETLIVGAYTYDR